MRQLVLLLLAGAGSPFSLRGCAENPAEKKAFVGRLLPGEGMGLEQSTLKRRMEI